MINAKEYFERLGADLLKAKKPPPMTIVDGRHVLSEDPRTPEWRKEVCDDLAARCAWFSISDDMAKRIEEDLEFEGNFLSVGSRSRLALKIEAYIRADQMRDAAE